MLSAYLPPWTKVFTCGNASCTNTSMSGVFTDYYTEFSVTIRASYVLLIHDPLDPTVDYNSCSGSPVSIVIALC